MTLEEGTENLQNTVTICGHPLSKAVATIEELLRSSKSQTTLLFLLFPENAIFVTMWCHKDWLLVQ